MQKAIEGIIDRLMGAVKSEKPFYSLKDLISFGFPPFIVEGIRVQIKENLKEELNYPQTVWADLDATLVKDAWNDFQESVFSNSRIPHDRLYELTKKVVTETVQIYLAPRQKMADLIFKDQEELDFAEVQERVDQLTIYKHFARAIPLYMKKRKLKTLEKKRCKLLIQNLDANLVASYSADDWAQALKLLFKMFGGKVQPELLQLFFEDKGLYLTAKTFSKMKTDVNLEQFRETLSDPDLLNVELQQKSKEKYRNELNSDKEESQQANKEIRDKSDEEGKKLLDDFLEDYEEEEQLTDEESFNALFKSEQENKPIYEEFGDISTEKAAKSRNRETEDSKEFRENLASVLDLAADSFNNLSQEEESEKESENIKEEAPKKQDIEKKNASEETPPNGVNDIEKSKEEEGEDADEKPMWQQFISPEQMDLVMGSQERDDEESGIFVEQDGFIDEPVVDIAQEGDESESEVPDLRVYLLGQEVFYIEELFKGSESDYERTLKRLRVYDDWEKASNYLRKDVFSSNDIDMYSDAAVDFTDQLQSYFKEYKK